MLKKVNPQTIVMINLIATVCILVFIVHLPALSAQALTFDDDAYLTENILVQSPSWTSAKQFLVEVLEPSTIGGYYQPLTMISLMLDCAIGGSPHNLLPFHRTSLILHVMNTALVVVLLYLLFGNIWVAAGVGLLFGLHPMTVETIPWVGERKTLLSAFFALWCLIIYICFTRKGNRALYIGCLLMYILAIMSKPISLPLPILMLLLDYWPLERIKWRAILEKIPFYFCCSVFAIITYLSQSKTSGVTLPGDYGIERIPLIFCHNIIFYLSKIICPFNLSSHYPFPNPLILSNPKVLIGVIGSCILLPSLVISLRWTRGLLTGWLFFFLAILPSMQIIGFSNVIASDKFAYLPSIGLLMVLTSFLIWFCSHGSTNKTKVRYRVVIPIILVLATCEAIGTRRHLLHWRDTVGLNKYMLTVAPNASPLHNDLAIALSSQGKYDEAISHYYQALQNRPHASDIHYNLANAFSSTGKLNKAINHYHLALKYHNSPYMSHIHNNLGSTLRSQQKFDKSISQYRRALYLKPDYYIAHYNLGLTLAITKQQDEALKHLREAVRLKPNHPEILRSIAWVLVVNSDANAESKQWSIHLAEQALKLTNFENVAILDTLAAAYAAVGQFDNATLVANKAFALASTDSEYEFANQIQRRLELYKQAKPYHEESPLIQNVIAPSF